MFIPQIHNTAEDTPSPMFIPRIHNTAEDTPSPMFIPQIHNTAEDTPSPMFIPRIHNTAEDTPSPITCFLKANSVGIPLDLRFSESVTSGFPLRASAIQKGKNGCTDLLLNGWDFNGRELDHVLATDVEHCRLLCMSHPNCLMFTYFPKELNKDNKKFSCYLKTIDTSMPTFFQENRTVTGLSFVSPGIQKRCITQTYKDVGFTGENQRDFPVKSYESCQDACTRDPSCPFFSYRTDAFPTVAKRGICSLIYANDLPWPTRITSSVGPKSGFPLRKCEGDLPGYVPTLYLEVSYC
ncbi:coagulation factor XI-like [Pleurodeles waltl]|uniref:coagulation factor XI-like n=1 Tax=Pleurodeles waltl TaxID=8319 RepID=UPI00370937D2